MDFIQPIGPIEREVEPLKRIERLKDEREGRERESPQEERRPAPRNPQPAAPSPQDEGPIEGDDGHLHIDIRA